MGLNPVPNTARITQEFGSFPGGYNPAGGHTGRDYGTAQLTDAVAIADGTVLWADWCHKLPGGPNGWAQRWFFDLAFGGIIVVIRHADCIATYSHMYSTPLNPGDRVRKGDYIGDTGNTGSATSGPHLHFEIMPPQPWYGSSTYGRIHPAPYVAEPYRINTPPPPIVTPPPLYANGYDVSAYQPHDIVTRVAGDFVIVKTTEGAGWTSDRWQRQLDDARRRGMRVGVYHYAQPGLNGSDREADYFVNTVARAGRLAKDLAFFLDWEEAGYYSYTAWARDFMARVDQLTGRQCGLYANTAGLIGGVWSDKDKARPLWRAYPILKGTGYATAFNMPRPPAGWRKLVLDQYSFFGRLPGYGADLDLNVYYGGLPEWAGIGSPIIDIKDWFDMADKNTLKDALREVLTEPAVLDRIASRVLDTRIELTGNDPAGKPYEGTTSLRAEAGWGTFRGFRDRRIEAGATQAAQASTTAVELLGDLVEHIKAQPAPPAHPDLAEKLGELTDPATDSPTKEA